MRDKIGESKFDWIARRERKRGSRICGSLYRPGARPRLVNIRAYMELAR